MNRTFVPSRSFSIPALHLAHFDSFWLSCPRAIFLMFCQSQAGRDDGPFVFAPKIMLLESMCRRPTDQEQNGTDKSQNLAIEYNDISTMLNTSIKSRYLIKQIKHIS